MTLGWHLDRMARRQRGEQLTMWPEAATGLLIAGPGICIAVAILVAATVLTAIME